MEYELGDVVFAADDLINDGSLPEHDEAALLATKGTRGVVVNVGRLEDNPEQILYLVRFEDAEKNLGPPVGCWHEELFQPTA